MLGQHSEPASWSYTRGLLKSFRMLRKNSISWLCSVMRVVCSQCLTLWSMADQKRIKEDSHGVRWIAVRNLNRIEDEQSKTSQAQGSPLDLTGLSP